MKVLFLVIFILLTTQQNFAQLFDINIKVVDKIFNTPISNANFNLSELKFGTTNKSGVGSVDKLNKGFYILNISHVGYESFKSQIEILSDSTIAVLLNPVSVKINEVLVTSAKYEKDINLIPYSVSTVDKNFILKAPALTISDLLKNESGITLLRDGIWGTEISIRGLNRSNIVTLIDGNRIETSTDISARLSMFDLNDVERIEVIKGSASSLYGSGATGGIINIISKTGSYQNDFTLNGNYFGGYNSVNNFYSNGLNIFAAGPDWLTKISTNFRKAGNTKTPNGELKNSQFEDNSFSALFQIKPFEDQEIKFNYQLFNAFDVGIPGSSTLFPNNAIVTYPEEKRRLLSVEYKLNNLTSSFTKLTAKYFHQFISRDVENIPGTVQFVPASNGQPPRRVSVLKISPSADHIVNGFITQADFSFANHYFIAGFDFWNRNYSGIRSREQKIDILNPADSSLVRTLYKTTFEKPLPDASFSSAGLYVQDEIDLLPNFALTLGGRYDFIWLSNNETINPLYEINDGLINNTPAGQKIIWHSESAQNKSYVFNIGLLYSFSSISNISFNAARSFRSPSLEERYQYIDLGSVIRVGNPNLESEQGYFLDLGFRLFPKNLNISSSVFLNSLTDLVTEEPGIYDGRNALIKTNIGKAVLYGFEYSIKYSLTQSIKVYNSISYVRGLNKTDDSNLPQIPPLNGLLGIEVMPSYWFNADFSIVAFDAQNKVAVGEKPTPGYLTFNFSLNFHEIKIASIILNLTGGIENILDKDYRNHLATNRGLIVSEPGRNIYVRTNIVF
ncbi:MAG: TonB-dependent receptor [Ignavibacteriaceae bacterium]